MHEKCVRFSVRTFAIAVLLLTASAAPLRAQFGETADPKGPRLDKELVQQYEIGVEVTADGGPCKGIVATTPMPIDWPEQRVRVTHEDIAPFVRGVTYRKVGGTVKQMVISIPYIPAGETVRAVVTLEISRNSLLPPENTSGYVIPKKLDRETRTFLGPSPKIESRNPKIKSLAKEITADKQGAWEKVEAIYDWVREHVKYENGPLKGAMAALKDKTGDCEELTSLFIALCRASDIPARTVWVPGHCYPEFYLEDDAGKGHWFPCQAAGSRAFGGIPEQKPILQKGDNFSVPENREKQRYVAENLTGQGGKPKVKFIRKQVARDG
jgi:transglutaminase-like putative cysteine protease